MTAAWNPVALPNIRLRRLAATSVFTLLSLATLQPSAQAQTLNEDEFCYAIADNNPPATGNGGGTNLQDTLSRIDNFAAGQASAIAQVSREGGGAIGNIEALTSRPDFGELIAANGNEIGRVDPETGVFSQLGVIEGIPDTDAIVIVRDSDAQTRLIGVSKSRQRRNPENFIFQVDIETDGAGRAVGLVPGSVVIGPEVNLSGLPDDVNGIDGIAISPTGVVYGVANGGPLTSQRLVTIDINSGATRDLGAFTSADGTLIEDVEDLSFDLTNGLLFATSGSNIGQLTDNAFLFADPQGGNIGPALPNNFDLEAQTGAEDYEASACIRFIAGPRPDTLLLVKRITAVTRDGETTRYDDEFTDQDGETLDNLMLRETAQNYPVGLVEAPEPLIAGDQVEYTVYLYNPTNDVFRNVVLCDALQLPSILQRDSIEFSAPRNNLNIGFSSANAFAERPLAPADDACLGVLDGEDQFLGSAGPNGPGGGVVTDNFNIRPRQLSAVRFVVEVGQL